MRRAMSARASSTGRTKPSRMADHDRKRMQRAIELARKGEGNTDPNPAVGCVIEDASGCIVGEGYHPEAGKPHAEVYALRAAAESSVGGTAYTTLEPCSHVGRTPPCARALRSAKLLRCAVQCVCRNHKLTELIEVIVALRE
jgi:diaminohydroxyphosphoribosylaminopyrimidine deaminase/5-amino-6-(5-phosphoribosylamino)uracil reductase